MVIFSFWLWGCFSLVKAPGASPHITQLSLDESEGTHPWTVAPLDDAALSHNRFICFALHLNPKVMLCSIAIGQGVTLSVTAHEITVHRLFELNSR